MPLTAQERRLNSLEIVAAAQAAKKADNMDVFINSKAVYTTGSSSLNNKIDFLRISLVFEEKEIKLKLETLMKELWNQGFISRQQGCKIFSLLQHFADASL